MSKNIKSPEYLRSLIKPIFEERFKEMLGEEEYEKFVDCIIQPQRKSFRVNTYKEDNPQQLVENLKNKGLSLTPIPWSNHAYFVEYEEGKRYDLGNLFEHFLGKVYVQEATSMTPVEVLEIPHREDIDENFKVLDMCASPGSKTTQIGTKMGGKGVLVANELDYKRLGPLKINLERSGFANIVLSLKDGTHIKGEEEYDRILLDAPCSGSGVIRKSPGTLTAYNPKKLKGISTTQIKLCTRAFELLKKGGIMTYSTCSLDPEENELLIKKFLENHPNAQLMDCSLRGIEKLHTLKEFRGITIPEKISQKTMRIWPHISNTNGFFLAKIKKLE